MQYRIKAVKGEEPVISLTVDAADEFSAREHARGQGYAVLAVTSDRLLSGNWFTQKTAFSTLMFSQQLLALLKAGLSLMEALQALSETEARPEAKRILTSLLANLYQGQTFSASIARFPQHFPALYIAAVRASEKTGDLPNALERYITYRDQLDRVHKKIITASVYPILLLIVGALVITFLMFYVIPRFSLVYEGLSTDLPLFSTILLHVGRFIGNHSFSMIIVLALLSGALIHGLFNPTQRAKFTKLIQRVPAFGQKFKDYEHARLYRTLGMLLRGGIPITQAMDMATDLLSVESRQNFIRASTLIREGQAISSAMAAVGLSTPIIAKMLVVGERTGNMGEMMDRIAEFYDEDLSRWVEWFTRLFEPILMAFIGLIIGAIVIMMYMPIFELAQSIS